MNKEELLKGLKTAWAFSDVPYLVLDADNDIVETSYGIKGIKQLPIYKQAISMSFSEKHPRLISYESMELYGVFTVNTGKRALIVIWGPVLTLRPHMDENMSFMSFSKCFKKETTRKIVQMLPTMRVKKFVKYLNAMCYLLTKRKCTVSQIIDGRIEISEPRDIDLNHDFRSVPSDLYSTQIDLNLYLDATRQGDVKQIKFLMKNKVLYHFFSVDDMRELFHKYIAVITMVAHEAVKGGLDFDETLDTVHSLIFQAERIDEQDCLRYFTVKSILGLVQRVAKKHKRFLHSESINQAIHFIEEHYHRALSLDDIASHVHLSSPYLSQLFRKETGENIQTFIRDLRLREAKNLLLFTKRSIGDIAASLGFKTQSYFTEVFKKDSNMTPYQYRKQYCHY